MDVLKSSYEFELVIGNCNFNSFALHVLCQYDLVIYPISGSCYWSPQFLRIFLYAAKFLGLLIF